MLIVTIATLKMAVMVLTTIRNFNATNISIKEIVCL